MPIRAQNSRIIIAYFIGLALPTVGVLGIVGLPIGLASPLSDSVLPHEHVEAQHSRATMAGLRHPSALAEGGAMLDAARSKPRYDPSLLRIASCALSFRAMATVAREDPPRSLVQGWTPTQRPLLGLGEFQAVPSRAFLDSLSPSPIRQAELIELMRLCRFNDVDFPLSETTDSEATWLFCALLSHESRMPIVTLPSLNRYFSQMRHIGRLARRLPFAPADVDAFVWQACANYMEFADDDGKYYLSQDTALYVEETPITVMLAYFERVARDLQFDRQRLMWWLERLTRPFGEFGGASSWIRHLVLNLCTGSIDESSRLGAVRREFGWATFVCETTLMGSSCTLDYMIRNLKSGYGQSVVVIGNRTPSLTVRRIGEFAEDSVVFALDARSCPIGPYNATPHKMRGAKFELDCLLMGHRHFVWDALDTTASLLSVVEWGGFLSARDLLRLNRSQELPRATIIWTCE